MQCKLAMVMRIELQHNDAETVLTLIGRICSLDVPQLRAQIEQARSPVVLDLREVRLVGLDAVRFLAAAELGGIELRHVPQYVREWILLERPRVRAARAEPPVDDGRRKRKGLIMERMLVVVFDNETKAYEGKSALRQLEQEGSITIFGDAVVMKNADGSVGIKQHEEFAPIGSLVGTGLGSLIGVLGGPAGVAIGAASGLTLGAMADLDNVRVGADFVADVTKSLKPGKVALVAEIDEVWTTPVDTRMEALGGSVFRRALWEVQEQVDEQQVAAMKADVAQFKAEMQKAQAERRTKLQHKVDELEQRIDARQKQLKERLDAFRARQKAKAELLKKNAAAVGHALKELAKTPL